MWDNGKENGNYNTVLGLYGDNGKENGNYNSVLGLYGDNGKENGHVLHDGVLSQELWAFALRDRILHRPSPYLPLAMRSWHKLLWS